MDWPVRQYKTIQVNITTPTSAKPSCNKTLDATLQAVQGGMTIDRRMVDRREDSCTIKGEESPCIRGDDGDEEEWDAIGQ